MNITINNFGLRYKEYELYDLCYPLAKKAEVSGPVGADFWGYMDGIYGRCNDGEHFPYIQVFICANNIYPYKYMNRRGVADLLIYSEIDLIRIIAAHEFYHITYGHPDNFKLLNGDTDIYEMEKFCDSFALAATGIKN